MTSKYFSKHSYGQYKKAICVGARSPEAWRSIMKAKQKKKTAHAILKLIQAPRLSKWAHVYLRLLCPQHKWDENGTFLSP
jgi:hypothetical protein